MRQKRVYNKQMQGDKNCATQIFKKIGSLLDPNSPYKAEVIFSQILLGSLFIQGYRTMSILKQYECCIFYKRNNFITNYLYLKFRNNQSYDDKDIRDIESSIKLIDDMKEQQQKHYKVMIGDLNTKSYVQLNKPQFKQYIQKKQALPLEKISIGQDMELYQQQRFLIAGKSDIQKLQDVMWTYINTFGTKYKNNYYRDLQKRNPTSYNIDKLLNTVNWIIYNQTVDKPYNQIEIASWTCFEKKAKEKLKPDRKDILLTGSGKIMMIHFLLLEKIENYKKEEEGEVDQVIFQFKKSYMQGIIKAYEIIDQLQAHQLIYKLKSTTLSSFTT